jgi:hypothetical protein
MVHVISLDSGCWVGATDNNIDSSRAGNPTVVGAYPAFLEAFACQPVFSDVLRLAGTANEFSRIPDALWWLLHFITDQGYCIWRPLSLSGIVFAKRDFSGYLN